MTGPWNRGIDYYLTIISLHQGRPKAGVPSRHARPVPVVWDHDIVWFSSQGGPLSHPLPAAGQDEACTEIKPPSTARRALPPLLAAMFESAVLLNLLPTKTGPASHRSPVFALAASLSIITKSGKLSVNGRNLRSNTTIFKGAISA